MFTFKGAANNFGTSATATVTHGLTIAAGDLIVLYINRNDDVAIDMVAGGEAWTELFNATPSGETSKHAVFYKIAGASEPASFSVDLTSSSLFNVNVSVWATENGNIEIDNPLSFFDQSNDSLVGYAVGGNTMAANALSITGAGKDRSATTGAHTEATESYTGVVGHTDGRDTAMGHRIFTEETLQNDSPVFGPNATTFDQIYSWHFSVLDVAQNTAVTSSGSFSEQGDALAASLEAVTAVSGAFAEQGDSLDAEALFVAEAAYSVVEQGDTLQASIDLSRQASASFAEQGDALVANVEAGTGSSFSLVEQGDELSSSAAVFLPASFALAEQGDELQAQIYQVPSIEVAFLEQGDALAAIVGEFTSVTAAFLEQGDDLDAGAAALISATAVFIEQGDIVLAQSNIIDVASANFAEQGDALEASATNLQDITYALIEQGDELDASAANLQFITYALLEQGDELEARGATLVSASFTHTERGDVLAANASASSVRKAYTLAGKTNKIKLSGKVRYELSD